MIYIKVLYVVTENYSGGLFSSLGVNVGPFRKCCSINAFDEFAVSEMIDEYILHLCHQVLQLH